jgi:hypothetical protein
MIKRERKTENHSLPLLIGVYWLQAAMRKREVNLLETKKTGRYIRRK